MSKETNAQVAKSAAHGIEAVASHFSLHLDEVRAIFLEAFEKSMEEASRNLKK